MNNKPNGPLESWNSFWRRHHISTFALVNVIVIGGFLYSVVPALLNPNDEAAGLTSMFAVVFFGPILLVVLALDAYRVIQWLLRKPSN
jgi:hypothetical protein